MSHDDLCPVTTAESSPCQCTLVAAVRADERDYAAFRVTKAPEHVVKIKGLSTAVITRSDADAS